MRFTLSTPIYPDGTEVKAYPVSNWPGHVLFPSGAPKGDATDSQTVVDHSVTFSGLGDESYFAHAEVAGTDRYVRFKPYLPDLSGI